MPATPDPSAQAAAESQELAQALHWLLPFHFFYEKRGLELPDFVFCEGREVPYPYRSLLVHENDMTPTLAAFHHSRITLEVKERELNENYLLRFVILHSEATRVPVEFGAIGIQLAGFSDEVRELILEGKIPLGAILGEHEIPHRGSPCAYFGVPADEIIGGALAQPVGTQLFGRCNQLLDADGLVFADIVEILPKSDESESWIASVK